MKKKMVWKCDSRQKACCHPGVDLTVILSGMLFLYSFLFHLAANTLL